MSMPVVIARAFAGKPLKAVIISAADRLFYIAAPDRVAALGRGETEPVGFPKEDIFIFNSDTYDALAAQWESQGRTDPNLWLGLSRYKS